MYVAMMWDVARRRVPASLAVSLSEPDLGNPITVRVRGQRVSEDRGNTLLEYATIAEHMPLERRRRFAGERRDLLPQLGQRPGEPQADGVGLPGEPASVHADRHVVDALRLGHLEGPLDAEPMVDAG